MSTAAHKTLLIDASSSSLSDACRLLQEGELVAFPTETVYGLGANALNGTAVSKVFVAKGRPSDNPLIVHVSDWAMMERVADAAFLAHNRDLLQRLHDRFWPGALTILVQRHAELPDNVTAGESRVGVRVPDNETALRLIRESGCPLAAPSANRSGRPSPTCAAHVLDDLDGRIAAIVDGGACRVGVESTVIDAFSTPPLILRPGGVTLEQLRAVLPDIELYSAAAHGTAQRDKPATPGLKYRHYAPKAPVTLVEPTPGTDAPAALEALVRAALAAGQARVGLAYVGSSAADNAAAAAFAAEPRVVLVPLGQSAEQVAHTLYTALRHFDDARVDSIALQGVAEAGAGLAVLNRMRKAASANSNTEQQPEDSI